MSKPGGRQEGSKPGGRAWGDLLTLETANPAEDLFLLRLGSLGIRVLSWLSPAVSSSAPFSIPVIFYIMSSAKKTSSLLFSHLL